MTDNKKRRKAAELLSRLADERTIEDVARLLSDISREEIEELLRFAESEISPKSAKNDIKGKACVLFVDGASMGNPGPAGAGAVIQNADGKELAAISKNLGTATSNVAEYRALILGLKEVKKLGFASVRIFTDSELMANQVGGIWRIKDEKLKLLAAEAMDILEKFDHHEITAVKRSNNRRADKLAKRAADMGE
ncbi:MAG: ribonuclease HI family protein [Deltaproteobacteria bacterium]|uniref:Ribonuclease HI family protein n=1 Tax=Candidatus Zymogenus saltonus TaxID=2844893 RepID=A0A9D8KBF1_9DELT|nr:ribonuclease HI family protein [Candidatus Zymogenus saltonus]